MISTEDFIQTSVAHQLGSAASKNLSSDAAAFHFALAASSNMTLAWDGAFRTPADVNGWQMARAANPIWKVRNEVISNAYKTRLALRSLLAAGADFDFLVDMQDHRTRNIVMPDETLAPVFTFNRRTDVTTGQILWPLPVYHDLRNPEFLGGLDPARVPWNDKKDCAVWRGGPGNRGKLPDRRTSIRLKPLLQRHKKNLISAEDAKRVLLSMPRYRFLHNWSADPRFDIGYTDADGFVISKEALLKDFEKPKIPRARFQEYKYIFVLPGSDVGSSFYWTMNSGSVGIVVGSNFETFASHHFKPWQHYIPVRKDQADIKRIMRWCERHQDECQAIAQRAQEMCKRVGDRALRQQVSCGLIAKIRERLKEANGS